MHRLIVLNQQACLKSKLIAKATNNAEKNFLKLMNIFMFKTLHRKSDGNENVQKNFKMNNAVYLALSILDISKIAIMSIGMKHGDNPKLCDMGTDSFIVHVKSEYLNENLAGNVKLDLTPQTMK